MNQVPTICGCETWSSTIGVFITNFGTLVLHIHDFLESISSTAEFSKLNEGSFYERVEFIKRRLSEQGCSVTNKDGFAKFFERLDPVRQTRNRIAHGILRIGLASDGKTYVQTLSLPKDVDGSPTKEARHLKFSDLRAELKTLSDLLQEFQDLARFKTTELSDKIDPDPQA